MWICPPPCGASNEPHSIFCAVCGVMRTKAFHHGASSVELAPLVSNSPAPELRPLRFEKTASQFAISWIGMSLAGAFLSWLILQALYGGFLPAIHRTAGEFGMRVASIVLGAIVYSLLIGLFQAKTLGGATEGSRWTGWMWCRLVGALLSSFLLLLFRNPAWSVTDLRSWALLASVAALAGGGLTGLLQSLVLYRKLGPPAWAV